MIKRRTLWIAPSIMVMLLLLGYCHVDWLKVEEMRAKPNTLRSRVLAYERSMDNQGVFASHEDSKAYLTAMMQDYFKIGMSEEECVRILLNNDLRVDEKDYSEPDYRYSPRRVYFSPTIVARVEVHGGNPLLSLQYRLVLRFHDGKLDSVTGVRAVSGP